MTYSGSNLGDLSIPGESLAAPPTTDSSMQFGGNNLGSNFGLNSNLNAAPSSSMGLNAGGLGASSLGPGTLGTGSLDASLDAAPSLVPAGTLNAGLGGGLGAGLGSALGGSSLSPGLAGSSLGDMSMPPPPSVSKEGVVSGAVNNTSVNAAVRAAGGAGTAGTPSDKHGLDGKDTLKQLHAIVLKFSPVADNSTFQYHIRIQYRSRIWEVVKRFSEFDNLLNELDVAKVANLPPLPPLKTLFGRPLDTESAEQRKRGLQQLVHDLLIRPDIRCSPPLRRFLALDSNYLAAEQAYLKGEESPASNKNRTINSATDNRVFDSNESPASDPILGDLTFNGVAIPTAPKNYQPQVLRTFEDTVRFSVAQILAIPEFNIILTLNQDASSLSRLGKVWSIIEADELANVHVWGFDSTTMTWVRKQSLGFTHKASQLLWESTSEKLFVGCGDGAVRTYTFDKMNDFKFVSGDIISLHGNAAITQMCKADCAGLSDPFQRRVLSISFDNTMRIFDVDNHQVVCGGRLEKRLPEDVWATCCYLDGEHKRAFIGTSGFDVLIFDVATSPPKFLYHHQFQRVPKPQAVAALLDTHLDFPTIVDGSYVSGIQRAKEVICMAHSNEVAVYPLLPSGAEAKMFQKGIGELKGPTDALISAVSVASDRNCVVAGFLDGVICIWRYDFDKPIVAVQAHLGTVSTVRWLDSLHPWGPALLTGGFDSKAHTWNFSAEIADYEFWHPSKRVQGTDDDSGPKIVGKSNLVNVNIANVVDEDEQRPIRFGDPAYNNSPLGGGNPLGSPSDNHPLGGGAAPVGGSALLQPTGKGATMIGAGANNSNPLGANLGGSMTNPLGGGPGGAVAGTMGTSAFPQSMPHPNPGLMNRGTLKGPGEDSDDDDFVGVF